MRNTIPRLLGLASCGLLITMTLSAAKTDWKGAGRRWWAHVRYLASDDLQGRNTGSAGYLKAADYVAQQFKDAGLAPAGTEGYFQDVPFDVKQLDEAHSTLALVTGDGKVEPLTLGEDATLSARSTGASANFPGPDHASTDRAGTDRAGADAAAADHPTSDHPSTADLAAAFVGYGFAVPELHFDEFAGVDLKGKVAVYLAGGPASLPEDLKSHYQSVAERYGALLRAGAVGVAVIPNPRALEIPWLRAAAASFQPVMDIADPALVEARGMSVIANINPERADKFFVGSGHTIAELLDAANHGRPLPKFPLAVKIRANVAVKRSQAQSPNVVGRLTGTEPASESEFVVISAHLDHLGMAAPAPISAAAVQTLGHTSPAAASHDVFNGAMDNAAGVASLIEIARWFHDTGTRPKRSLIFIAVTGEERGELGSLYFCAHPTVALGKIVADLNMDMYLPLFRLKHLQVQGLGESTLGDEARSVARENGVEAQFDLEPGANRFIRSDQYSFIKKGIPAVAFKFGYLPNTRENKIYYDFVHTRYHATSDDTNNPDIDPVAAAQFDHIVAQLALRVADSPARPEWHADSFFRRFVTTAPDR